MAKDSVPTGDLCMMWHMALWRDRHRHVHRIARLALLLAAGMISLAVASPTTAHRSAQADQPRSLRVVTKPIEPLVIKQGDQFTGFSIDLWNQIASQLHLGYHWVE